MTNFMNFLSKHFPTAGKPKLFVKTMSRRAKTDARHKVIFDALLAVMIKHGYERTTIISIAEHAGLTPALIHYHFETKVDVLFALISQLAHQRIKRYQAFAQSAQTAEDQLCAYINARLAKGEDEHQKDAAAWTLIGAEAVGQQEVRDLYQKIIEEELTVLNDLIVEYLKQRGKSTRNSKELAASLLALMEGTIQLASTAQKVVPIEYSAKIAIQLIQGYGNYSVK